MGGISRQLHSFAFALAILGIASLPGCTTIQMNAGPASANSVAKVPVVGGVAYTSSRVLGDAYWASGKALGAAKVTTADLAVGMLDSGPAPHSGFLVEPERMVARERGRHPFQRVWVSESLQRERYHKVVVAPVALEHMIENSWWDKLSTATLFGLDDDAERLAGRLKVSIEEAFREDPHRRFELGEEADDRTLILEIALVEVVPNKSFLALGALVSIAGGPAVSAPIGLVASRSDHGYVAIEGLVRDGGTGEVLAMFADRETAKTRVLDLQTLLWYGHAHEIIDEWAVQLVAVADRPASPGMADPTPFTLMPW